MSKKEFKIEKKGVYTKATTSRNNIDSAIIPPDITVINFPSHPGSQRNFDFKPFYGKNCDHIVYQCQRSIEIMLSEAAENKESSQAIQSIASYCQGGLNVFFPFCEMMAMSLQKDLHFKDIDNELILRFINYLGESSTEETTQKNRYTYTKSVLISVLKRCSLKKDIFPQNPYPNNNRKKKGEKSLSKSERTKVLLLIKQELQRIKTSKNELSSYDLTVCVLGIALRTGLNPTPILELPIDCIESHPLKSDRKLLVSYKRRGNNTHIQSLRNSTEVTLIKTIMMDVHSIIEMIKDYNAVIRPQSKYPDKLFIYKARGGGGQKNKICFLSNNTLSKQIKVFVKNFAIKNDNGTPLVLNVMILRKTFINRIWALSGQDPFLTATLAGHSLKISNDHYLEVPPDAEKNWRLMGEIRNEELLNKESTPIAACKDTKNGDLAPKNESHCINYLNCFRCRSFVVTADDLYRLYSFYWLLVSERQIIGAKKWKRYYAHIIRVIDNQISPKFNQDQVDIEKRKAQITPHPFWKNRDLLNFGD